MSRNEPIVRAREKRAKTYWAVETRDTRQPIERYISFANGVKGIRLFKKEADCHSECLYNECPVKVRIVRVKK